MKGSLAAALLVGSAIAYDVAFKFDSAPEVENRTIEDIHRAALVEGGVVTCWHGGDEKNQGAGLKSAFEAQFPGMTLNITIDLSKYHDGKIDEQLAKGDVFVDSVILQTVHDYPRWAKAGALLNYAPLGFDRVYPSFKDSISAYWYGLRVFYWNFGWNTDKLPGIGEISSFQDFLKPEFKDKLVLTYPNDDDAVLFAFQLIMQVHGLEWFDALLAQNPRWVRGTGTPVTLLSKADATVAATFTSFIEFNPPKGINVSFPTDGQFVSWPQTGAILKDAPHPEGAKLLHSFILSRQFQDAEGWSVRDDAAKPEGFQYPDIMHMPHTNPTTFGRFMADREAIERLSFWFEDRIGSAQGLSPLEDGI